jgi:hypothetical protein
VSQIEQRVAAVLARRPEIEKCYRAGLLNRRALARFLVAQGVAPASQLDAVIATVRRHEFGRDSEEARDLFREIRVSLRDGIVILDFGKEQALLERLERLVSQVDYNRGDTLKVVVGTSSVKLFINGHMESSVRPIFQRFKPRARLDRMSEISLIFPEEAITTKGIVSTLTRELDLHEIVITEVLTASPELLIYVRGEVVAKAYDVILSLQSPDQPQRAR